GSARLQIDVVVAGRPGRDQLQEGQLLKCGRVHRGMNENRENRRVAQVLDVILQASGKEASHEIGLAGKGRAKLLELPVGSLETEHLGGSLFHGAIISHTRRAVRSRPVEAKSEAGEADRTTLVVADDHAVVRTGLRM